MHRFVDREITRRSSEDERLFRDGSRAVTSKVEENLEDAFLLSALGLIDAALGRKEEAITEARRAVEILPFSKHAREGPALVCNLAGVYSLTMSPNTPSKK